MALISSERLYTGRIVSLDADTVGFPDGSTGRLEMLRHPGASAVVPFLDDPGEPDPRVILLRQFRHAAEGFIWEVPAGRLDPGESPETCARRELEEETGMRARALERLTTIYTTPGLPTSGSTCSWRVDWTRALIAARLTSSWSCTRFGGRRWGGWYGVGRSRMGRP